MSTGNATHLLRSALFKAVAVVSATNEPRANVANAQAHLAVLAPAGPGEDGPAVSSTAPNTSGAIAPALNPRKEYTPSTRPRISSGTVSVSVVEMTAETEGCHLSGHDP